jgi:tRNA G18 (ribose-2'-O)-methylase SpoU
MTRFLHERHKPPRTLARPRELVVALPPMRSHVNLSRIVRTAGCCGVTRVIACGHAKIDREIARDAAESVQLEVHRTLPPVLGKLKQEGYVLVGLEQTTNSRDLHHFAFPRKTALIVGHERNGLTDEELSLVDEVVEIPVWGRPFSYNAATAASLAMYEYCKQWPEG